MPAPKHYPGSGDVKLIIGDAELTLRPTLDAALALSRESGGIRQAITKVANMDIDAIVSIIKLGVGREEAKRLKNLERMVYENGLLDAQGEICARCIEYLSNLARGGRSEADVSGADGDESEDRPTTQAQ